MSTRTTTAPAAGNGRANARRQPPVRKTSEYPASAPWGSVEEAAEHEEAIREEADAIRATRAEADPTAATLTPALFMQLWPLLRRPLHPGHIVHTTAGKGKPYESDGARSVQVLIDRMNNVLTPLGWDDTVVYHEDGKLCEVTVRVLGPGGQVMCTRSSWGGVNQGSTSGNIRKGSYTNAAKLAFARIGPGHEIYTGALDLDPDVNPEIAAQQDRQSPQRQRRSEEAPAAAPDVKEIDPDVELAALLALTDSLAEKRKQADDGMGILGATASQRARELKACGSDEGSLDALIGRINAALDPENG